MKAIQAYIQYIHIIMYNELLYAFDQFLLFL